jgi:cbb3-type cytochrome oxidase cytochrome c subunit
MNHGPLIFLGVLATFIASWWGLIFSPQLQLGSQQPKTPDGGSFPYPAGRPGIAQQGHAVYVSEGCVYCHSQQVRQQGYTFDVVLTGTTNEQDTVAALVAARIPAAKAAELIKSAGDQAPQPVKQNIGQKESAGLVEKLQQAGASAQPLFIPVGADMKRGWGPRQSVALDYLRDYPVQIGNSRLGPDLANVGGRPYDEGWHLRHLYNPRSEVKGSIMPAYQYLFEKRKIGARPSIDALKLPAEFVEQGYEIIPKPEARALVAYLKSLRVEAQLFEAPMTQLAKAPVADTNAPAGGTNAPAGATNAPATTNTPAK